MSSSNVEFDDINTNTINTTKDNNEATQEAILFFEVATRGEEDTEQIFDLEVERVYKLMCKIIEYNWYVVKEP